MWSSIVFLTNQQRGSTIAHTHYSKLTSQSYTKTGKTDGVVFRVKSEDKNGEEALLFERFLNPLQVDEDQGSQIFTLEFHVDTNADLVLETQAGPAKSDHWDWSYWTQIKIE